MPDTYRDRKRQQAWAKAEAKRVIAQEQADALTALGVPCAQRDGWVVLLDPVGLRIKLDPSAAVTGWAAEPCARCGSTETRASIDGLRYCHGEQRPSCYELAQWESRGIVAAEATLPAVTAPDPEPHSGKGEGSDAHREARRRARAAFAELRRIDPPCSCPEQTYLDRVATYTAPAGVEPHAATCPRNGQLEGDRLDWLAADYPATQWPSEGGRG